MSPADGWILYAAERPPHAGIYEWRTESRRLPGLFVIVAAHMRMRGAGYQDVLSPSFDSWDGYSVSVPADLQWRATVLHEELQSHECRLLGVEGLEHADCIYCCRRPVLRAMDRSYGGVAVFPQPWFLNRWWLECCDWGKTPAYMDPRQLESFRRSAFSRAAILAAKGETK